VRDELTKFEARQVRPFGVNPAPAVRHSEYAQRLELPFPLLSDPDLAVSAAYGAVHPGGASISRTVVLVEQGGIVRFAQPGAPGADLVLEALGEP
jgi:peroxiredoxin